jgi:hypothetical protein
MGARAGLDDLGKTKFLTLPVLELRPLNPPTGKQSLYRLVYPQAIPVTGVNAFSPSGFSVPSMPICSRKWMRSSVSYGTLPDTFPLSKQTLDGC